MSYLGLKRHEIEEAVEADLLAIAQDMIPNSPAKGDLARAFGYFPSFFGGIFPALGLGVERTEEESRYRDKPDLPGVVVGRFIVYYPSMPAAGPATLEDDRTGEAKWITRRIRGEFIERIKLDSSLGRKLVVVRSMASDRDPAGTAQAAQTRAGTIDILWRDQTEFQVTI